ncbi:hypothetical protein BR93DRAFT_562043 [Coniochaeta sp. PMI_546]|nr:hypothetical protein BR93DRAFT_562043 [Coniochaeta sp. PMI_546]
MAKSITEASAKRIFVSISSKSRHWSRAWDCSEEVIEAAVACLRENGTAGFDADMPIQPMLLVKERWSSHILWIVFDILNTSYDPDSAHLPEKNDLPVIMVSFTGRDILSTSQLIQDKVNKAVREAHDVHGVGSRPPFVIDHANGNIPTYRNPQTQVDLRHST